MTGNEEITLEHYWSEINLDGKCLNCNLRQDIDDGMNITSYCLFDDQKVDKLTSNCHLSQADQEEINHRKLIKTIYIK